MTGVHEAMESAQEPSLQPRHTALHDMCSRDEPDILHPSCIKLCMQLHAGSLQPCLQRQPCQLCSLTQGGCGVSFTCMLDM